MREPNNVIISSKIAQQTMFLCGHTAKTLNELADELGVAPVYLEEIIEKMVQVKLLIRPTKNKYLSCCCVFPMQPYINASYISYKTSLDISLPEKICKAVKSVENEMTAIELWVGDKHYTVTGTGYAPEGEILLNGKPAQLTEQLKLFLEAGYQANDTGSCWIRPTYLPSAWQPDRKSVV